MSGRSRLPGGQQRRASQRHSRPAAPAPIAVALMPSWMPGDRVRWKDYTGQFLRDTVDGQAPRKRSGDGGARKPGLSQTSGVDGWSGMAVDSTLRFGGT
jgi:hypothetical protein